MDDPPKAKDERRERRDRLEESYEPTPDDLDLLKSHVPGHEWQPLTRGHGNLAFCSCGWHSVETDFLGPMLRQVKDHLDIVQQAYGTHPPTPAESAPAPGERDASQSQAVAHSRVLRASLHRERARLSQMMERSAGLLSEGGDRLSDRADMLTRVKIRASAQSARGLQRQIDRVKELRKRIAAAAEALAVIHEELAWVHLDQAARRPGSAAEYQRLAEEASKLARQARDAERTFSD